jgi:hypothetical protein
MIRPKRKTRTCSKCGRQFTSDGLTRCDSCHARQANVGRVRIRIARTR